MKPLTLAALGAALGSVATAGATLIYLSYYDSPRIDDQPAQKPKSRKWTKEIIDEQQARTRAFLTEEGLEKIRNSSIVVVGVGGVGSWVTTMLARSGVGRIRIIDFDQVTLSSLNRHACATLEDVGTSKVTCLRDYLQRVCPWVEIETVNALWTADRTDLVEGFDYVVDCIDNIDTKVDLLAHCYTAQIPVISSMGAGCKGDPTRIQLGDISMTSDDPLSRSTRIKLRFKGITGGIPVVFSTEKPGKAKLLELDDSEIEKGNVNELSVLQDFRVRILPVLGPLPALFGLTIATHLLTCVGGYTDLYDPVLGGLPSNAGKGRAKLYETLLRSAIGQFARMRWPEEQQVPFTQNEIEYLYEEVWRGHTLSGPTNRAKLTLWDPSRLRDIHNMVPVTLEQQKRHEAEILKGGKPLEDVYTQQELDLVAERMALDKWYQRFRS